MPTLDAVDFRIGTTGRGDPKRLSPAPQLRSIHEITPGTKTLDRQGRTKEIGEPSNGIPKEMRVDYYKSAEQMMMSFIRLRETDRDRFLLAARHPKFAPIMEIFNTYTRPGEGGQLTLDTDALRSYLVDSREGWMSSLGLRKVKLDLMLLHKCKEIRDSLPPPGPEDTGDSDVTYARGGAATEGLRKLKLYLKSPNTLHGRKVRSLGAKTKGGRAANFFVLGNEFAVVGAGLGLVAGPIGVVPGAIVGAGAGYAAALLGAAAHPLFRRGGRLELNDVRQAFDRVQRLDPIEAEMVRDWLHIDSRNREVRGGKVRTRRAILKNRAIAHPENSEDIDNIILAEAQAIRDAKAYLGFPPEMQSVTDNIFSERSQKRKHTGYKERRTQDRQFDNSDIPLDVQVQEEMLRSMRYRDPRNPNRWITYQRRIADPPGSGNYRWVDNVGQFRDMRAFNLDYYAKNFSLEAREMESLIFSRLLAQQIRKDFNKINAEKRAGRRQEAAEARRAAHDRENGALVAQATARTDRQIELLNKNKEGLDRILTSVGTVSTHLDTITSHRTAETTARGRIRAAVANWPAPGGGFLGGIPGDQLRLLNDTLNMNNGNCIVTVDDEHGVPHRIQSVQYQEDQADIALATAVAAIPPATHRLDRERLHQTYEERHQRAMERIQQQRQVLSAAINAITEAHGHTEEAELALSGEPVRPNVINFNRRLQESWNDIRNWSMGRVGPNPAINLNTNAMATQSFEEIQRRINAANARNPARGWPPGENGRSDRDLMIRLGMAEAQAITTEPLMNMGATPPRFREAIGGWRIGEEILLTMSHAQLEALYTQRAAALAAAGRGLPGAIPTNDEIAEIQRVAQVRFDARQRCLRELITDIDRDQVDLAEVREREASGVTSTHELDLWKQADDRKDEIIETITEMTTNQLIANLDPGPPDPRMSRPYEVASGDSGAAIFLRELIGGSRTATAKFKDPRTGITTDGNEGAYNRDRTYLTNYLFQQRATRFFGLAIRTGPRTTRPPADFTEAMNVLRLRLRNGTIDNTMFTQFIISDIIDEHMGERIGLM